MQETSPNLSLDGIDKGSFEVLLDFLYSSKLEVNSANVDRLLSTSQSLEISSVVELCKQYKNSMAGHLFYIIRVGSVFLKVLNYFVDSLVWFFKRMRK